jgi:signal transduction histidine kinase
MENIASFISQQLEYLLIFLQSLPKERQQDLFALFRQSTQQNAIFSSREKRQLKRNLVLKLKEYTIAEAEAVAEILIDIGIYEDVEALLPLLKDLNSQSILKTAYQLASVQKSTRTIITATDKASNIVFSLKNFSRLDQAGGKVHANLIEGIETVLILYYSQLKHGIEVVKNYTDLPLVACYPSELNQVWANLVHNALQAMECNGTLTIEVKKQETQVQVDITDSGKGIPEEIKPHIFEPFFTTKPPGEGSGLGLNIVKRIIEKHQGKITVDSRPGKTTFSVYLSL